jgi:hypothetical protein
VLQRLHLPDYCQHLAPVEPHAHSALIVGSPMKSVRITLSVALSVLAVAHFLSSSYPARGADSQPSPKVDGKGFVDVWQLRKDIAVVEPLYATDDTEHCVPEGDPDNPPRQEQIEQEERASAECAKKVHADHAAYQKVWKALNAAWLPSIYRAIRAGDTVAEVIMRQCATTAVLDRSDIESTCAADSRRRAVARERLTRIGFVPAFDVGDPPQRPGVSNSNAVPDPLDVNQAAVLNGIRGGVLGFDRFRVERGGNLAQNESDVRRFKRWALIEAVLQEAPRVFTFSPGNHEAGWATEAFESLRLNRQPLAPGFLTWGPALHYSGGSSVYTGPQYWRSDPVRIYPEPVGSGGSVLAAGVGVAEFERERSALLAEIDSGIDRKLREDPRWGVFLLHRIGHHEWVPEGIQSTTGSLDAAWEGTWILKKQTPDWTSPMQPVAGRAVIQRRDDTFHMSVAADREGEPFWNVEDCVLRYSGGLTYPSEVGPTGQKPMSTLFGYMYAASAKEAGSFTQDGEIDEAVTPFDPAKRYKQVLMLCERGESTDSARVRFLLLAGDTLVEVGAAGPFRRPLAVRHYDRVQRLQGPFQ